MEHQCQALMITTAVVVAIAVIASSRIRRWNQPVLKMMVKGARVLSIPLISYTLSKEEEDNYKGRNYNYQLLSLSMVFLLVILTHASSARDSSSSLLESESDGESLKEKLFEGGFIREVTNLGCTGYLLSFNDDFRVLIWLVYSFIIVKLGVRTVASFWASQSYSLGKNPMLVAGYMLQQQQHSVSAYRYLVTGEEKVEREPGPRGYVLLEDDKLVTVDSIDDPVLKERCVSFALFKLLRLRFEGYPLAESNTPKRAFEIVLSGPLADEQKAFALIERELAFLTDYYYSPLPVGFSGVFFIYNAVIFVGTFVFCVLLYVQVSEIDDEGRFYLNLALLFALMAISLMLGGWEIISYRTSDWPKVVLECKYLRRGRLSVVDKMSLRILRCVPRLLKPWHDKLQQYSLFDERHGLDCNASSIPYLASCLAMWKTTTTKVPPEAKVAIAKSLKNSHGQLTRGEASLRRNKASENLAAACHMPSNAETLVVWHIATSFCDMEHTAAGRRGEPIAEPEGHNVACSLSKYCAYLLAFVPELLPDDTNFTSYIMEEAASSIRRSDLSRCGGPVSLLEWLTKLEEQHSTDLLEKGAHLWQVLMREFKDESRRWKLLSEVWVEMVLYMAPSDNVAAHARWLENGGEFITHVWTLVGHAGIVDRSKLPKYDSQTLKEAQEEQADLDNRPDLFQTHGLTTGADGLEDSNPSSWV